MNESRPVSVVIPARDAAGTLPRALASVLAQHDRAIETIVVDDGSRDATAAVAERFAAAGVRCIQLPQSAGAAHARNVGVEAARGEYVAFQDADDEWLPGKLAAQLAPLEADPDVVFVACAARLIGADGTDRGLLYDGQAPRPGEAAWRGLLARNTIATPTVVARRAALLAEGGFDTGLRVAEDQDMWIRLAMRGKLAYVPEPLVLVHEMRDSLSGVGTSRSWREQMDFTLPMIERHLARRRADLSPAELRGILGERLARVGRAAYTFRDYGDGLRMIARATMLGYEPLQNLRFLLSAAPPSRWLKRRLRACAPARGRP